MYKDACIYIREFMGHHIWRTNMVQREQREIGVRKSGFLRDDDDVISPVRNLTKTSLCFVMLLVESSSGLLWKQLKLTWTEPLNNSVTGWGQIPKIPSGRVLSLNLMMWCTQEPNRYFPRTLSHAGCRAGVGQTGELKSQQFENTYRKTLGARARLSSRALVWVEWRTPPHKSLQFDVLLCCANATRVIISIYIIYIHTNLYNIHILLYYMCQTP